MKNKFLYLILMGLVGTVILNSCAKKIDAAYANPNALTVQPIEIIFPSLIGSILGSSSAAGSSYGMGGDGINIGRYVQYWGSYISTTADNSGTWYDKMGGTTGASDAMGSMWAAHYYGMGQNLNRVVQWGGEQQKWDYVGAAWALRAWSLFESTQEYGEMILREAFDQSRQQFDYDQQSEIYDSVRATCFRSLNYLSMTGGGMNPANFANSDYYFNQGDLNRWKKFVYGILARTYAYISNKTTYNPDSVIYYASLSCAANADNITCKFQNTVGVSGTKCYFGSFRSNVNQSSTGIRQSKFIADLMSGNNPYEFIGAFDPRCWYMLRENTNGTFKGYSPSYSATVNPALVANDQPQSFMGTAFGTVGYPFVPEIGRYVFRDNPEWPVMTASEMQFLIAEANMRKGQNGAALAAYTNAISLNFDMLSSNYATNVPVGNLITPASKAAYLANPNVVPAAANLTLTKIMLQKYIALFGWGFQETWSDLRRYHYGDLDPATGRQVYAGFVVLSGTDINSGPNGSGSNNGKLVYRCRPRYNSEYLYNIPALTAIGAYPPGNDYHTKECWFSKP